MLGELTEDVSLDRRPWLIRLHVDPSGERSRLG
jgi:hypothetical protein